MEKQMNRFLAMLLALLMLCPILTACSPKGDTSSDTTNSNLIDGGNNGGGDNSPTYEADDLPDSLDYGGEVFRILCGEGRYGKSYAETYTGDTLNSALYNRYQTVIERLNVDIVFDLQPDGHGDMADITQHMQNMGEGCDLVQVYNMTPALMASQGLVVDMADTAYLNFEKPWWSDLLLDKISVEGKIFFATDNSSWNNLRNMMGIFVNKTLFSNYNSNQSVDVLYDKVENKAWTMAEMFTYAKNCYKDENGDTEVNEGDIFGLSIGSGPWMESWYYAAGFTTLQKDENGEWSFNVASSSVVDFIDYFNSQFYSTSSCTSDAKQYRQFCRNESMFYLSSLAMVEQNIESPYAVLPLPMYTADQGRYYTHFSNSYDMYAIPVAVGQNKDRSSAVLECLASEAYRQIAPAYFETYLKTQNASDGRLQDMYDIIRDSIVFDMGICYAPALAISDNYPQYYPRHALQNKSGWVNIAAKWTADVENQYLSLWEEVREKLTSLK
ncbi:MAG: hypothetical protein IKC59_05820 [Clostridia bacterium]|nr:hypothetical protein [Clostridia bacterium]